MNGYAVIAFATPIAAFALGALAVVLHRRLVRRRLTPEERAERWAQRERDFDRELVALEARGDEVRRKAALLRAELRAMIEQDDRNRARRKAESDGRVVATG